LPFTDIERGGGSYVARDGESLDGDPDVADNDASCDGHSRDVFSTPNAGPTLSALLAHASTDPLTLHQALSSPNADSWSAACKQELHMLEKLHTWDLVELPPGHNLVDNKWVFKHKADGRFKARLVAKGFTQRHGVDYNETFSPVARFESLRLLLAAAALEDWEVHSMDVKSAFLHGDLHEDIYMAQPHGFVTPGQEGKVCKLNKALYGLKQASREWNLKIHQALLAHGFKRTLSDSGVYILLKIGTTLIVVLYVDDITILGSRLQDVLDCKTFLASQFEMTDLGETTSYLGLHISRDRKKRLLHIDQEAYISDLLHRFGMSDCNPALTPLPSGADLVQYDAKASSSERGAYQQLIGSLLYAMVVSRPDISFAVTKLAQFSSNPSPLHYNLAKHVLRYLKGTAAYQLTYDGGSGMGLIGFSDSDWAGDKDDRKSMCGHVFLLAGAAISWASRKQDVVALSSTEAEYISLSLAAVQAKWLRTLLSELYLSPTLPTILYGDNKGSIDIANNPIIGRGTKHIDIRFHFIRQCLADSIISLHRLPSAHITADTLTKSLPLSSFHIHRSCLGLTKTDDCQSEGEC